MNPRMNGALFPVAQFPAGAVLLCLVLLSAGCRTADRILVTASYQTLSNSEAAGTLPINYELYAGARTMDEAGKKRQGLAFEAIRESVNVYRPHDLGPLACIIAEDVEKSVTFIESQIGVSLWKPVDAYLIREDAWNDVMSVGFPEDNTHFCVPFVVRTGAETPEAVLNHSFFYPYPFAHEIVELSISHPALPSPVLADITFDWGAVNTHTRWFREGLSEYAAFVLRERYEGGSTLPAPPYTMRSAPLSSLSKVGVKLFDWNQAQFGADQKTIQYYEASLGLFLLLEQSFGREAIRQIVRELPNEPYLDRKAVLGTVNRVCGTDIQKMVRDFRFEDCGAGFRVVSPATAANLQLGSKQGLLVEHVSVDSPAGTAGLRPGDIVLRADGKAVTGLAAFEWYRLQGVKQGNTGIVVLRGGQELVLSFPSSSSP